MSEGRYEYSVVDVCEGLHGDATGTGDSMSDTTRGLLTDWLRWRIAGGWTEPTVAYDAAVRCLARAALAERAHE